MRKVRIKNEDVVQSIYALGLLGDITFKATIAFDMVRVVKQLEIVQATIAEVIKQKNPTEEEIEELKKKEIELEVPWIYSKDLLDKELPPKALYILGWLFVEDSSDATQ